MTRVVLVSSVVTIAFLMSGTAHAQEPRKVGITMGYPSAVGVIFQVSDNVAIRPTLTYGGSSSDSTTTSSGGHNWSLGTTISALFYLRKYDNVRTFVSPSYRYSHISTSIHPVTTTQTAVASIDATGNSHGGSGTFGAEYAPGSRVRIYGEPGFSFTHATNSSSNSGLLSTSGNSWGTTAGVGLVFYP